MNTFISPLAKTILSLLIYGICLNPVLADDYYWVGGSGNWSDFANHWATSSGGSSFHTITPSVGDDVIFDLNSFISSGQTVTLDITGSCNNMDWSGTSNNPTLSFGSNSLTIRGSLTLDPNMAVTGTGTINFTASSAGNTITTGGMSLTQVLDFNGTGEWILADDLSTTNNIFFTTGTLNTNDQNVEMGSFLASSGVSKTPYFRGLGSHY